ncbi:MAG: EGF domain-containing protein, partial [Myxococcota bacterium]
TGGGGATGGGGGATGGGGGATGGGGGATGGGGGAMGGGGGGSGVCAGTLIECGGMCVDRLSSLEHCGGCGNVCSSGRVCINGTCAVLPDDCTVSPCGAGYSCDPLTRRCTTGCRVSTDCPAGGSCNAGTCTCPALQHACGQACVANTALTSCGSSCVVCTAPTHATPSCNGTTCGWTCDTGWMAQGASCVDVNECATNNGGCAAVGGVCTNLDGSRSCACAMGFTGDGVTCTDVNECATNNGGCPTEATCTNIPGSRTCTCPAGYALNGSSCVDINECTTNNGGCSLNATCTNTPGSRTCACNAGYSGDGLVCSAQSFGVVRVGSGAPFTGSDPVTIEVRDVETGGLIRSFPVPTSLSGANHALLMSGNATTEGVLNVSGDGAWFSFAGSEPTSTGTPYHVVGRVNVTTGAVDTSTLVTDAYNFDTLRTAAANQDATGYWLGGSQGSIRWVTHGSTGATTLVHAPRSNVRATHVVGGQLYGSSPTNPGADPVPSHVFGVGMGLPMTQVTTYLDFPGVGIVVPGNFALLDLSTTVVGPDTLYVVDNDTNAVGLRKYVFSGTSWAEAATFPFSGAKYFVAAARGPTGVRVLLTTNTGVYTWVDTGFTGTAPAGTRIVLPSSNLVFRGISIVP